MELHGVELARLVGHAGDGGGGVAGDDLEAGRQLGDLVAMAHPDIQQAVTFVVHAVLNVAEQRGMPMCSNFRIAELAVECILNLAAQLSRHGLHAVTDAQYGYSQFKHGLRGLGGFILINGIRTAGKNNAGRFEVADELVVHVPGVQFAVNVGLAHAAGNQLGVLGTEVENEDFLVGHGMGR